MRTAALFLASLSIAAALAEPGKKPQSGKDDYKQDDGYTPKGGNSGWDGKTTGWGNKNGKSDWGNGNKGSSVGWDKGHMSTWSGSESCSFTCATEYSTVSDLCDNREKVRWCVKRCQPEVSENDWYGLYQKQDDYCTDYKVSHAGGWDGFNLVSSTEPAQNVAREYYDGYDDYNDGYSDDYGYGSSYPYAQRSESHSHGQGNTFPVGPTMRVDATVHNTIDAKRGGYSKGCCPHYSGASMTRAVGALAPMAAALAVGLGNRRI